MRYAAINALKMIRSANSEWLKGFAMGYLVASCTDMEEWEYAYCRNVAHARFYKGIAA